MLLGGPAYISPLNAGFVIAPLLAVLSPTEFSPVVILAALRSLNSVADSVSLEHSLDSSDHGLLQLLYTEKHLSSITELLSQGSNSLTVQQQISLAAVLISKTCREETHRKTLAQMGVLEALAIQLSSFIVATGCCLLSRGGHDYGKMHPDSLPTATTRSRLSPILEAVGTIIQNSKRRAIQFLSAPAFATIFSRTESKDEYKLERKENERSAHLYNPSFDSLSRQDPFDALLPQVPNLHHRSSTTQKSGFPPLGTIAISGKQYQASRTFVSAVEVLQNQDCEYAGEEESPLVAWLFYSVRAESGITRLMAARVLAMFYRFGLANRRKETGFRMLLVPLLARMLDKESKTSPEAPNPYDSSVLRSSDWIIKEQAPAVLAMLAVDNVHLRRAAVDAGAIKKLSQLLKESYDPLPTTFSISLWTPAPMDPENPSSKANASKLGVAGFSPLAYHIMRVREEVLIALAAIASLEDEHRKAIIDNGVVPFVIESLKPFGATPSSSSIPKTQSEEIKNRTVLLGNPSPVILAACGAARMLSRSVSTLRTSLMDAGLAPPLFDLLRYQDMDIQIAATAVICNLLLEFSPMREVSHLSSDGSPPVL